MSYAIQKTFERMPNRRPLTVYQIVWQDIAGWSDIKDEAHVDRSSAEESLVWWQENYPQGPVYDRNGYLQITCR